MNTIQNHNGKLAVMSPWKPDYDNPVMGRVVWASSYDYEERFCEYKVEAGGEEGDMQAWAMVSPFGGRAIFRTNKHGDYITGSSIKPPRKRKGQPRPWRWHRGEWVCSAEF